MELEHIKTSVTFYLEDTDESRSMLEQLRGQYELVAKSVEDSEWKDNWKAYFKPAKITDKIVIKPTWEDYEKSDDELVIEIDPGMAFGTGTHPTTSLCVKFLERYSEPGKNDVLDVGCGSGILAIASALLGAKEVLAVDIDPVAVEVSKENVELNQLSHIIEVMEGDLTKGLRQKADIAVANLMADLVKLLSKDVAAHLKGKSIYISSGILIEKQEEVVAAIEECGFRILDILEEGEWCAIAAEI
jgi:ribosomal protein L11 methyltransferase